MVDLKKELEKLKKSGPFIKQGGDSTTPTPSKSDRDRFLRKRYKHAITSLFNSREYGGLLIGDSKGEERLSLEVQENIMRAQYLIDHFGNDETGRRFIYKPNERLHSQEIPILCAINELEDGLKKLKEHRGFPDNPTLVDSIAPLIEKRFIRAAKEVIKHKDRYARLYGRDVTNQCYNKALKGAEETEKFIEEKGSKRKNLEHRTLTAVIALIAVGALAGIFFINPTLTGLSVAPAVQAGSTFAGGLFLLFLGLIVSYFHTKKQ